MIPLFQSLMSVGYISPKEPNGQGNSDETCRYHLGAKGHSIRGCEEFKDELQRLIDHGLIRKGKSKGGRVLHDF